MMSKIIQTTKTQLQGLQMIIIPIAAYTFMHHPDFSAGAEKVMAVLSGVDNEMVKGQMVVPVALRYILPVGLLGGMCAIMFSAFVSNHDMYLLSWGSVFVQDIILPITRKTPTPRQHLIYLRWAVLGVAVFIFCFSLLFRQTQYIYMFWAVTAAIWLGGAGSVIIGGLYWKRGTTAAAYSALIIGSGLAVASIVLEQIWPSHHNGALFPINGQWMGFISTVSSIIVYVLVSLLGKRTYFDLDKLLHRGAYAIAEETTVKSIRPAAKGFKSLIGMTNEFTRRDVVTYVFGLGCTALLVVVFVVGTVCNLMFDVTTGTWAIFWKYFIWTAMVLGSIIAIWISIGGLSEMPALFERLRNAKRDDKDDGSVG